MLDKHSAGLPCREYIACAASGYLLVRGVVTGAHTVVWSMPALAGEPGRWSGILLFAAGCMVIYLLRKKSVGKIDFVADIVISALFVLHCAAEDWSSAAADGAAVIASIILSQRTGGRSVRWLMFAILPAIFLPLSLNELNMLRLTSLCGVLSAAGMCGTALASFDNFSEHNGMMWLIIGAALGMIG